MINIMPLGSKSPIKVGALNEGFNNKFSIIKNPDITAKSSDFNEYEQPISQDTIVCAHTRMNNLVAKFYNNEDYKDYRNNTQNNIILSVVESGIFGDISKLSKYFGINPESPNSIVSQDKNFIKPHINNEQISDIISSHKDGEYYEHVVYIFKNLSTQDTLVAHGKGYVRDKDSLQLAFERGLETTTVSHIEKEKGLITNDKDPFVSLTGTYTNQKPNDDGTPRQELMVQDIEKIAEKHKEFFNG